MSEQEVGGKHNRSEGRGGGSTGETWKILDVCPAVERLPNPLLDPGAARAAETTVGGSGMRS